MKKKDNDQETTDFGNCVDLVEIPVFEHANTETNDDDKKEWKDVQTFESLGQVHYLEIEQAIDPRKSTHSMKKQRSTQLMIQNLNQKKKMILVLTQTARSLIQTKPTTKR